MWHCLAYSRRHMAKHLQSSKTTQRTAPTRGMIATKTLHGGHKMYKSDIWLNYCCTLDPDSLFRLSSTAHSHFAGPSKSTGVAKKDQTRISPSPSRQRFLAPRAPRNFFFCHPFARDWISPDTPGRRGSLFLHARPSNKVSSV